jgi:hypothetical protein
MTGNMKDQNVPGRPVIVFDVNETPARPRRALPHL